jgi:hypothetical protein
MPHLEEKGGAFLGTVQRLIASANKCGCSAEEPAYTTFEKKFEHHLGADRSQFSIRARSQQTNLLLEPMLR